MEPHLKKISEIRASNLRVTWERSIQYVESVAHDRIRVRLRALIVRPSEVLVCGMFNVSTSAVTM